MNRVFKELKIKKKYMDFKPILLVLDSHIFYTKSFSNFFIQKVS